MKTSCTFILSLLLVIFTGFSAVGAETPDGRIEGFVSGLNGSSASGVKVNIWDGKVLKRAVSGRDGKFIVSGIIPGSSFAIRLTMPDSQTVRAEGLRCPERGGLALQSLDRILMDSVGKRQGKYTCLQRKNGGRAGGKR